MSQSLGAQKRVKKLFSEIKSIADQSLAEPTNTRIPAVATPAQQPPADILASQRQIELLHARICELEALLAQAEAEAQTTRMAEPVSSLEKEAAPASSLLYEKEQVGYVFQNDQLIPVGLVAAAIPDAGNLVRTPLVASGQVIGEMQVRPSSERALTPEDENLASAVAQQVSLQIQNLRLLNAAQRARVEALEATRQFTHQSWESFLDGIRNSERIGYAYDQKGVEAFIEPAPAQTTYQESVRVLDEQVGELFIQTDPDKPLTDEDKALISSVAAQISQQVENIRLLADAARARADAEAATRRLTRENWEAYTQQVEDETLGFVYDSNTVSPIGAMSIPASAMFEQPLVVQGEPIGQLQVMGLQDISPEARELAASIATQASIHLETLRLNEELQKRARELQELDRLKSAFLANMSHELRTPLNSILGFTDVMLEGLDGPLTDYMDNDLRLVQKNGQHLLHLINDVLDMAKIESGRMNLHPEKFKVQSLLEEVTSITSTLASEKNVALFIDEKSDQAIEVYADNTRLRQVMINLVNNSIKFTEKGKISICAKPVDGARILIAVKDTGIGIPPDKLEAVFQEFTQVDTSSTRKVGGTGLGLPISRRLVEMHGGRLWAESTGVEGEGSTFLVELPLEARITDVIEKKER